MSRTNNVYFATLRDSSFLDELKIRVSRYRDFYASSGLSARWASSLGAYYGTSKDGKTSWQVTMGGENGELVQQKVNEYASNVKHELTLAVKDRPAGIAKAVNWDVKTLRDARIGSQLVEYYLSDPAHNFEGDYIRALRLALLTAEAFVVQNWDTSKGDEMAADPETGETLRQGDLTQWVYGVWDAARDLDCPVARSPWWIFSRRINKYELAAQFPAYAEEIVLGSGQSGVVAPFYREKLGGESDYIEEFLFIHFPSLAMPKGRFARFTADTKFMDVDYPYPSSNVHRVFDEELIETSFGHTSNYDLLGLEQVTDALHSIALNNQTTFGVATILAAQGSGITHQDIAKGLRFIEVAPNYFDKIKTLDLVRTAPEIFNYLTMLSQKKGELSGINSIIKGDPQGALKGASGSAMALLQSQALVMISGVQKSFYALLASGGTGVIEMSRQFADEPRIIRIAGKANRQAVKEFKYDANTLKAVSTVIFEPVNPVLQTAAGKVSIADNLLEKGLITSPKRYLEVLTTGNLDVLIGDDVALQDAILEENEYLSDGKPVSVVVTENHEDHIKGHQATVAMPNAKSDPKLVQRILEHIQEHIDKWQQLSATNPALLLATGQKVLPAMPQPGVPGNVPMGGEQSSQPGNPPSNAGPKGAVAGPSDGQPSLPNPPKNPATGEPAPVADGTSIRQAA